MRIEDTNIKKVDDNITVTICENGFIVEVTGRDTNDDWTNVKIICLDLVEVTELINSVTLMDKNK